MLNTQVGETITKSKFLRGGELQPKEIRFILSFMYKTTVRVDATVEPPSVSVTWVISLSCRCASSQLWQITIYLTQLTFEFPINVRSSTQLCHRQQTEHPGYHFQTKMKSPLVFLLVLILCYLCRAQTPNINNDISVQVVESGEERAQTLRPTTEAEGGQQVQEL